ncbi:MAG: hypothetical protein LIO51_04335, partial [Clostridiales bacterium]|nr:hypothetical protein [Clostridiales bacterium]
MSILTISFPGNRFFPANPKHFPAKRPGPFGRKGQFTLRREHYSMIFPGCPRNVDGQFVKILSGKKGSF